MAEHMLMIKFFDHMQRHKVGWYSLAKNIRDSGNFMKIFLVSVGKKIFSEKVYAIYISLMSIAPGSVTSLET